MAIKSKVYSYLKKYLDEYLYGFEKDQLDVALMAGQVNLVNVNFKPAKVNRLLEKLGLPFAMRAGLIGKLSFKYHYTAFMSNPLEIEINELLIIFGPVVNEPPYDFGQLRGPDSDEDLPPDLFVFPEEEIDVEIPDHFQEERSFLSNYFTKILKNLTLVIKTLVMRYEDEVNGYLHPFACGFFMDEFEVRNAGKQWEVSEEGEVIKTKAPRNSTIKDFKLNKFYAFGTSMASMMVPSSLWEDTLASPIGIFEAIAAYEIRELILEEADGVKNDHSRLIWSPCDVSCCLTFLEDGGSKFFVLLPDTKIRLSSAMTECFRNFQEYFVNSKLWWLMAAYRPKFNIPLLEKCKNTKERKFRKKIVRQWFKYAFKFVKAKRQLRKYIVNRKNKILTKKQNETDKKMDSVMAGKTNCEHFPKWLVNSFIAVSASDISLTFFQEESKLEQEIILRGSLFKVNATAKEMDYFVSLTQMKMRVGNVELLRCGRMRKVEEKVSEGIFRTTKSTVVLREASHAMRVVGMYRPEAIRGISTKSMYEMQVAMSRVHLKYSQPALLDLFHIYEVFKVNRIVRESAKIVKTKDDNALILTAEEKIVQQLQALAQWAKIKEKQLLFVDFYFSVKFKGLKIKLIDNLSSCELSLPNGELVAAKDERLALFKIWNMQVTTYDSLNGLFSHFTQLNKSLSQKLALIHSMFGEINRKY